MNIRWPGRRFPIVQLIWWGKSKGLCWHRWKTPSLYRIFRGSLVIGRLEIRVWR